MAAALFFTLNLVLFNYSRFVVLPLLAAFLLLALCVGLGDALAAVFRIAHVAVLDRAALGLMATTAFFFLAGLFHALKKPVILGFITAAACVVVWRIWLRRSWLWEWVNEKELLGRPLAEYAVFIIPLAYAALPPTFYDSLVYHLGIPNLYLQSGGFIPTPQFVYANTFIYYEIALIPAVFLGDLVPRLFHFFLGALFVLSVADEAVEHWGVKKRLHLILALVSLPMTLFLLVTCKNDLVGAIFIFLAISQARRENWKLAAAFWGFAVGIKYFNLLPLAAFLLVTVKPWKKADLKKLALMALVIILVVSPLLLKNFHFTGNPFFPFLYKAFPAAFWDGDRFNRLQEDVGKMVHAPADLVRLPYSLSFFNHGYGGLVGPLFLIFLPFLLLGKPRDGRWLGWALLLLGCAPFLTASLRFIYAAFVVLAILSVRAYEEAGGKTLKAVFYAVIALNFIMGFAMLETFYQAHSVLGGKFTSEQYKEKFFPTYPAFAYLNAHAPIGAKVLVAGEARNYYLHRPYQVSSALDYGVLNGYLDRSRDAAEFTAALRRDGFSYLLVNFSELQRLQAYYANMTSAEEKRLTEFLGPMKPIFDQGPVSLYQID